MSGTGATAPPHFQIAAQQPIAHAPYDRWIDPSGNVVAQFFRLEDNLLVRFPGQADFLIDPQRLAVSARVPGAGDKPVAQDLWHNAIMPLIGNHTGALYLHGSAVSIDDEACAFLGHSQSGKTTLAGAFATTGDALLCEDAIPLEAIDDLYRVQPARPVLRLFGDSARLLLSDDACTAEGKHAYGADHGVRFAKRPTTLRHAYFLGDSSSPTENVQIGRIEPAMALASLMQHAFILDVQDKARLEAHFLRLAAFAENVRCYSLAFPRDLSRIAEVAKAVGEHLQSESERHGD